jgi:hypothetical protein
MIDHKPTSQQERQGLSAKKKDWARQLEDSQDKSD